MKISMFVTGRAMQFNLEPETDYEKEMFDILDKFTGAVTLGKGHDIGMCQGNYIRNFGHDVGAITITIEKPEVK